MSTTARTAGLYRLWWFCGLFLLTDCGSPGFRGRPITTSGEIRTLSEEQAQRHPVAHLQGVVTYADVGWKLLFLQDSTGGVRVEGDFPQTLKVGQLIKMTGIVVSGGKNPTIADPEIEVLPDTTGLPPALATSDWTNLAMACRRVEVRGVVRSAALAGTGRLSLIIRSGEREIKAWVSDPAGVDFPHLPNSEVLVRGVATTIFETDGTPKRADLWIADAHDIQSVGPALGRQGTGNLQPLDVLTSVAQVHRLSPKQAAREYPVHLRAIVTFYDPKSTPSSFRMLREESTSQLTH